MKKNAFLALIAILSVITFAGCVRRPVWRTMDGSVWRTTYHIVYRSDRQLDDSVIGVLNRIDASLSPFNRGSIVSAVNRGDTSTIADSHFRKVFAASRAVWEASDGRFDPTLGPAITLWGFGPGHDTATVTDACVDSVRALVGIGECAVDRDGRVTKKQGGTQFNFSAIAKGYACDEVGAMLRRNGVADYLVEIGGEIALAGVNDRGKPWRVMVDAPVAGAPQRHERLTTIELGAGGVATSGNYRNYRDIAGEGRVGHTILPSTCRPAPQRLLSVTVTASDCMTADALATACMTADTTEARMLMGRFPGAGCLIVCGDSTVVTYGKFPRMR